MSGSANTPPLQQQLRRLADEIRVKLHLAGMEAKDAWSELEPRLHEYERKAESATEKIASEVAKLGKDLKQELTRFHDKLTGA